MDLNEAAPYSFRAGPRILIGPRRESLILIEAKRCIRIGEKRWLRPQQQGFIELGHNDPPGIVSPESATRKNSLGTQ
jgi:hypothetical protein